MKPIIINNYLVTCTNYIRTEKNKSKNYQPTKPIINKKLHMKMKWLIIDN